MTKLADLIDEISMGPFGSDIKVDNFVSYGVPVLNGSNLPKYRLVEDQFRYVTEEKAKTFKKAIARRGDIVITHRGTLGQISFIPDNSKFEQYVISQSQFRVRLKTEFVSPTFFVYYFHTNEGQKRLLANKCHVGVPALAQATTNFRLITIPLPKIETQEKIASILSSLDAKIDLNNRINAKLEAMAKTLYDYWFVQFDFPDQSGKPYKSSGGVMVCSKELKREIPQGWNSGILNDLGQIIGGSTPSKAIEENFCKNGMAWITPKDLSNNQGNKFISAGEYDVSVKGIKEASLNIMPKGTILLSTRAPIGYIAIARNDLTTNQGFKSFVPNKDFSSEFIYFVISNSIQTIENNASGSTFKEISSSVLQEIKTLLAEKKIRKLFDEKIQPIFKKQDIIEQENQQLAKLRDWLLPMLMNGQVSVS